MRFDNVIKSFFCVLFVFFTTIEFEGLIFRKIRPNLLYICDYYTIEYVGLLSHYAFFVLFCIDLLFCID